MFGVYIHDAGDKTSKLLKTFTNKLEAQYYLEEIVDEYIAKKDGEDRGKTIVFTEPSSSKSASWKLIPFEYCKTRNTKDSLYKITVWHKVYQNGYLYNSYEFIKIFSVDLIYLPASLVEVNVNNMIDKIFADEYYEFSFQDLEDHKKKMEKVFVEITTGADIEGALKISDYLELIKNKF